MNLNRILLVAAALATLPVASVSAADAWRKAVDRGHLIMATVADRYPLSYRDETGVLAGFDIDVAHEIGARMGLDVVVEAADWGALTAGDWRERWDFSVSSMTPTAARETNLDFPAVYSYAAIALVVHRDNKTIQSPPDANGRRIGVAAGTTLEQYLKRELAIYEDDTDFAYQIADPVIVRYNGEQAMFNDLAAGDGLRLDGAVTAFTNVQALIDRGAPLRLVPGFLFFEPFAVAVDKGENALGRRIGQAIEDMVADGTLSRLSERWFGIDLTIGAGG